MKILVTGGAGYIGSITVHELISRGHDVVVFDNLSTGHMDSVDRKTTFSFCDLRDERAINSVFLSRGPFDAVLHLASLSLVQDSFEKPVRYLHGNVVAGANLIRACVHYGINNFVFASMAGINGSATSPCLESKAIIERMLYWFTKTTNLNAICLRYSHVSGATSTHGERHDPETHLIPSILKYALYKRGEVTVSGDDYSTPDGTCVRDYVHVQDVAIANCQAVELVSRKKHAIYSIGSGVKSSTIDVINCIEKVTGCSICYSVIDSGLGEYGEIQVNIDDARNELGWLPQTPQLYDIIKSAWEWEKSEHNKMVGG